MTARLQATLEGEDCLREVFGLEPLAG